MEIFTQYFHFQCFFLNRHVSLEKRSDIPQKGFDRIEREKICELSFQRSLIANQKLGQDLWYLININPMEMYCWSIILPSWDRSLSFPETTPIPRDTLKATTNPLYTVHVPVLPINRITFSYLWQPLDHFLINFNFY